MGANDFASSLRSGAAALPGMMCTCCAAPVTEGLRARSASVRSAVTFFLANPVLNPATLCSWALSFRGNMRLLES